MSYANVLLGDNQFLTATGLRYLLNQKLNYDKLDEVSNWLDLYKQIENNNYELIILDYTTLGGNGLNEIDTLLGKSRESKIILFASDSNPLRIKSMIEKGIMAYLTKECSELEILNALDSVKKGKRFYCSKILDVIVNVSREDKYHPTLSILSRREREIFDLVIQGCSSVEMGEKLSLSIHTVNSHRKNINKKLNIKSTQELMLIAMENGLLK
jgi:DNA-binding NarL/FixJ family response regulator